MFFICVDDARHLLVGEDRRLAEGQRLDVEARQGLDLDGQRQSAWSSEVPSEIWPCWPSRQASRPSSASIAASDSAWVP